MGEPVRSLVEFLIMELDDLKEGWDGEYGQAALPGSIHDALALVWQIGPISDVLEPTLHADGSVLLEIGSGASGCFRLNGDGKVTMAIDGCKPATVELEGFKLPPGALKTLEDFAP